MQKSAIGLVQKAISARRLIVFGFVPEHHFGGDWSKEKIIREENPMLNENGQRIHIVAIIGTRRPGNFTSKAMQLVVDEIRKHEQYSVDLIDPATMTLPFPGENDGASDAKTLQEVVSRAAGVILSHTRISR